jgi:hypothetical protein
MGSYTDAITQFNPYVSTLPVEAMVKVGMQKQAQYEQGVQKIQQSIDNVAGMDVLRDVDKNYLQTKLNELGNNLKYVAAGDFSNFQLVNSVSGMAKQIGRDETVQNAVSSTAFYRKQAQEMESASKQGKSSTQNQWDFNEKVNKYVSSTDLNEKFTGRYKQYTDVDKKYMEVLKQLHPNLAEQDIPYERNTDGSLNMQKTAAAMSRITKETVSSAQIENALRTSLTPDDMDQLSINGRYTFRNLQTPEQLQQYSKTRFGSQIKDVDGKIQKLEGYKNLVTSDAGEYNKTVSILESLKSQRVQLQDGLNSELEMIAANPDEAKFQIYKNGSIAQFANAFSWETNKTQLLTNVVLEAKHWEQTYALDQSKFALSVRGQNWTEYKGQFDMDMADKNYKLAVNKQITDLYGAQSGAAFYGGKSTFIKSPDIAMQDDINSNRSTANTKFNEILKGNPNVDAGMLEGILKDYANGGKSEISKIPVEWRDEANVILQARTEATRLQGAIDRVDKEILNTPELKSQKENLDLKLTKLPGLKIGNETFSNKEIFYFLTKDTKPGPFEKGYEFKLTPTSLSGFIANTKVKADPKMTEKERVFLNFYNNISKESDNVRNLYKPLVAESNTFNQHLGKERNKKLSELTGKYLPVQYNINVSSKDGATSRDTWEGIAGSAMMVYQETLGGQKGGSAELSQGDIEKGRGWLTTKGGKDDIQYKKLVQGDKTFLVLAKGNDEVTIPLPDVIAAQLPVNDKEPSRFDKKITEAKQLGNGNTNPNNIVQQAVIQRWDLPNIKNLNVNVDVKGNKTTPGKNYIVLNLSTPSGWKRLELDDYPIPSDKLETFVNGLTDKDVKAYFINNPTTSASLKEQIKNL